MNEMQTMILSLLLFIAYRIVNPSNERDMETLAEYRDYLTQAVTGATPEVD